MDPQAVEAVDEVEGWGRRVIGPPTALVLPSTAKSRAVLFAVKTAPTRSSAFSLMAGSGSACPCGSGLDREKREQAAEVCDLPERPRPTVPVLPSTAKSPAALFAVKTAPTKAQRLV